MTKANPHAALADELAADRGANRELDARIAVALYSDADHTDPRDNTHARIPSKSDDCAPGTYWISAFSGLSLRAAPDYTSDQTLKRLALAALRTQPPADTDGLVERLLRKAYRREIWHEPDGTMDAPCDEDDYGAEEYFVNPDGPEAATALTTARAHIDALLRVVDEGWEALEQAAEDMTCRGDGAHYCPNCDRSTFAARERARAYLSTDKPEVREAAAFVKREG
jgi:hypothetical protein